VKSFAANLAWPEGAVNVQPSFATIISGIAAAALVLATMIARAPAAGEAPYLAVGAITQPPVGWSEFCGRQHEDHRIREDCAAEPVDPRDIVLTPQAWHDLVRVNQRVNAMVKPMADHEQWGVVEKWDYPDTGYGDCEDYVLLKRRLLIDAGWPRSALLITVVRDRQGDGHAVLTVRTDRGEFILDNQNEDVLPWAKTGYRFVKRQSQSDPNVWVSLGMPRPEPATSAAQLSDRSFREPGHAPLPSPAPGSPRPAHH
jgi:predicted transglutaminase-like cysteine proteinase